MKRLNVEYEQGGYSFMKTMDENQSLWLPERSSYLPYLRKPFEVKEWVQRAVLWAGVMEEVET